MTKNLDGEKGEGKTFEDPESAIVAYNYGEISFRAKIKVLATDSPKYKEFNGGMFETTLGRILFNRVLPETYPFLNVEIDRKRMGAVIENLIEKYGIENIPGIMDDIKNFGFKYATQSGTTWGIDDVTIPAEKNGVINKAKEKAEAISSQYNEGLISEEERMRKNIEIWHAAKGEVEKLIPSTLSKRGSVFDMVYSGARGSFSQITQMVGMKGLIQNTAGQTIEFPILSCSKEGLSPLEYFITTHGSRKGLTDTALNTAKAGYLTRRLFDVAQDIVVAEDDCGSKEGILLKKESASGIEVPLSKNIKGRFLALDAADAGGKVIAKRGDCITKEIALAIEHAGISEVTVRSPLSCKSIRGVCVKCYGFDLGKNKIIEQGEAVGTIAAQAIGEPGTQLTMRTFHAGGTASVGGDITRGLPRVEEVFEKRKPKNPAIVSHVDGMVSDVKTAAGEKLISILPDLADKTKTKNKIALDYSVSPLRMITVKVGDKVKKGDLLTDGSADPDELFKYAGREKTEQYIIHEISKLYELQGEAVSRKHIEVIVRQMFSRRRIKDEGGTTFSTGDLVELTEFLEENRRVKEKGLEEAKGEPVIMGITEVSLSRRSFLSAASFQHTTRVLISGSLKCHEDALSGLKENVIIGNLIPAGTGFPGSAKSKMIEDILKNSSNN
jgi:DNA-directed RNA polymerase subunit beta'